MVGFRIDERLIAPFRQGLEWEGIEIGVECQAADGVAGASVTEMLHPAQDRDIEVKLFVVGKARGQRSNTGRAAQRARCLVAADVGSTLEAPGNASAVAVLLAKDVPGTLLAENVTQRIVVFAVQAVARILIEQIETGAEGNTMLVIDAALPVESTARARAADCRTCNPLRDPRRSLSVACQHFPDHRIP